ncbi:superoxide dismutase [Aureibacter tunicatorum]|uniref:superoxide dismutase n=1 Tax=Aureibacter tunicatorum TaxID=866807 RepID=A0AAE4BS77_9BACT|nr:superoxide dismutase [Aureibacter tunicatorum]MDR6238077.1 Fe-Mn family superoxide dismutase [Aureibacter tunicatorum]BDD03110.1 hypothetical protein AUTU_05930 [Aureibacter tunicatorum]
MIANNRRSFLGKGLTSAFVLTSGLGILSSCNNDKKETGIDRSLKIGEKQHQKLKVSFSDKIQKTPLFQLPLPYGFDALEPYIDKETMYLHYTKHHAGYVKKMNAALEEMGLKVDNVEQILSSASKYPAKLTNNAGGQYNHTLFWTFMKPNGGGAPSGNLSSAIDQEFGSFENFKKTFQDTAMSVFGSGWAWLICDNDKKLRIVKTANQNTTIADNAKVQGLPLLGLDVWEHAYYLKYKNLRKEYVENWFNIINWNTSEKRFDSII